MSEHFKIDITKTILECSFLDIFIKNQFSSVMQKTQIIPSKPKPYTNVQGFDTTGGNETPYLVSDSLMEIEDKDKPYSIEGM